MTGGQRSCPAPHKPEDAYRHPPFLASAISTVPTRLCCRCDSLGVTSALFSGVLAALLEWGCITTLSVVPDRRTLPDQLLTVSAASAIITGMCATILGSWLRSNAASCSEVNFDLFMLVVRPSVQYYDLLYTIHGWGTAFTLTMLPLVMLTPRTQLPDAVPWLSSLRFSAGFAAATFVVCAWCVAALNTSSVMPARLGLFLPCRAYSESEAALREDAAAARRAATLLIQHAFDAPDQRRERIRALSMNATPPAKAPARRPMMALRPFGAQTAFSAMSSTRRSLGRRRSLRSLFQQGAAEAKAHGADSCNAQDTEGRRRQPIAMETCCSAR